MSVSLAVMFRTGALLALFAVLGAELVSFSYRGTVERIEANRRSEMLDNLNTLIPPDSYDNDLLTDTVQVRNRDMLGTSKPLTVYRARRDGRPVAVAFRPVAPEGYGGPIRLLVGIDYQGHLLGVRVLEHKETPGLGDKIELRHSDWILGFNGLSLDNPPTEGWRVKRDGGNFDQFTGATITPRAVVKAVHKSLQFYRSRREEIFSSE